MKIAFLRKEAGQMKDMEEMEEIRDPDFET